MDVMTDVPAPVQRMIDAQVDFSNGSLVSENPITVGYGDSKLSGKRLSVTDGGKVILIEGDVRTTLMPPKRKAEPPAAGSK